MDRVRLLSLAIVVVFLSGCAMFQGQATETPFEPAGGFADKHIDTVPLSEDWNDTSALNYTSGHFTFPPPAGYKVLNYVDYVDNISLDLFREVINDKDDFLDIIKYRQGADHCKLHGEKFTSIEGIDLIEVKGDCYIWHKGDFKRKYYFVRVGPIVFTFRLLSGVSEFEENLKEFDAFVDFAINNYLIYPLDSETATLYEEYAYPMLREDLISFFQPGVKELEKIKKD